MTEPTLRYTVAEAARAAGVSEATIRKAIHATAPPYLEAQKAGARRILIRPEALEAWLDSLPPA
jgi:excisionase family DNA binding protein